jgi:hypothetical protein
MTNKKGFGGQWVEIFLPGTHTDNEGRRHTLDARFLEQVVNNFDAELHEPPVVIGHPEQDAPAYGSVAALRVNDAGRLVAQFCDTDPAFEEMVRAGKFKKRSAAFYLDAGIAPGGKAPSLRHVGFLGAQPPSVKGLKNIHFDEGDEAVTFEVINFSEGESSMKKEDVDTVVEGVWDKFKKQFGFGDADKNHRQQASFSEADVKRIAADAVSEATSSLKETVQQLQQQVQQQATAHSASSVRADIAAFCEELGGERLPPALRKMGVIKFMETLAALDEKKIAVIGFAEEGGKQVEKEVQLTPLEFFQNFMRALPRFIQFGEQFGQLTVKGTGAELVDPQEMDKLRAGTGTKGNTGGDK